MKIIVKRVHCPPEKVNRFLHFGTKEIVLFGRGPEGSDGQDYVNPTVWTLLLPPPIFKFPLGSRFERNREPTPQKKKKKHTPKRFSSPSAIAIPFRRSRRRLRLRLRRPRLRLHLRQGPHLRMDSPLHIGEPPRYPPPSAPSLSERARFDPVTQCKSGWLLT
jgi:hypothetical protein